MRTVALERHRLTGARHRSLSLTREGSAAILGGSTAIRGQSSIDRSAPSAADKEFDPTKLGVPRLRQSRVAPEAFTVWVHFATSLRRKLPNCSGVSQDAAKPCTLNFSRTDAIAMASSSLSRSITAFGVPAGVTRLPLGRPGLD